MNRIITKPLPYRQFNAVFWLIGINILIFAATRLFGDNVRIIMTKILCMIPDLVLHGWVWSFVTYMFMHADIYHLLFNMFGLFIFGIQVERQMGSSEFLLYYFVTGTLAGILSFGIYVITGSPKITLLGASGAIFAVQLAYAVMFPNSIIYIWGLIPVRAAVMVLGFTALELFFSIFSRKTGINRRYNVAHLTHLAGFAFGWLYFMARFRINPWRRLTNRG